MLTAHFSLQMDGEGLLNDELPNCWECPKCYQGDDSEKGQVGSVTSIPLHPAREWAVFNQCGLQLQSRAAVSDSGVTGSFLLQSGPGVSQGVSCQPPALCPWLPVSPSAGQGQAPAEATGADGSLWSQQVTGGSWWLPALPRTPACGCCINYRALSAAVDGSVVAKAHQAGSSLPGAASAE